MDLKGQRLQPRVVNFDPHKNSFVQVTWWSIIDAKSPVDSQIFDAGQMLQSANDPVTLFPKGMTWRGEGLGALDNGREPRSCFVYRYIEDPEFQGGCTAAKECFVGAFDE